MPQLIFKSLYTQMLTLGVPMPFAIVELFICVFGILMGSIGLLAIPLCLLVHLVLARLLSVDVQILNIIFDLISLPLLERIKK